MKPGPCRRLAAGSAVSCASHPNPGTPALRDLNQVSVGDAWVCALSAEGRVRCAAFGTGASALRSGGQADSR